MIFIIFIIIKYDLILQNIVSSFFNGTLRTDIKKDIFFCHPMCFSRKCALMRMKTFSGNQAPTLFPTAYGVIIFVKEDDLFHLRKSNYGCSYFSGCRNMSYSIRLQGVGILKLHLAGKSYTRQYPYQEEIWDLWDSIFNLKLNVHLKTKSVRGRMNGYAKR